MRTGFRKSIISVLASVLAGVLVLALMAATLTACQNPRSDDAGGQSASSVSAVSAASATAVTFTDDNGDKLVVDKPQRVIACLSSFAQIWQLAGGEALVGLTDDVKTEGNVELPADVQYVGSYDSLNLEAIIALEPDFVILTAASRYKQTDLKDALQAAGINFAYFNVTHFEDYLRVLQIFTEITGRSDLYQANGTEVQAKINDILAKAKKLTQPDQPPTAAFFITESRGTRIQDGNTMPGRILVELGCKNLADDKSSQLSEFSIEALIEANPSYIFVLPMGNSPEATAANLATLEANPAWADIPAVKNGRYFKVDQEHFLYKPNNHWDESYQIIFDDIFM